MKSQMKRSAIGLAALFTLAACCLPGKGENQPCNYTPDCQVHLVCLDLTGADGGSADGGIGGGSSGTCKFECSTNADCPSGETCQGSEYSLHCDTPAPDGG